MTKAPPSRVRLPACCCATLLGAGAGRASVAAFSPPRTAPPAPSPLGCPARGRPLFGMGGQYEGLKSPVLMGTSELRAELSERRIDYSECFDKESLADMLFQARAGLVSPMPETPATAVAAASHEGVDPRSMRVKEIKSELKEMRIKFSDCYDKESLVERLFGARAGTVKPMPSPGAPKGADFEFGAQFVQGDASEAAAMEDAFRAAGWTGEEAGTDPSKVDETRSPGMNRYFADVAQKNFRKPYSGGRS